MEEKNNSIIKQTGIVGGVQVVRLSFGLIRNKLIALFFGTEGIGIWAILMSFTEMMQQAAFMGMDKAGVKKVSENNKDKEEQLLTIKVVKFSFLINSIVIALGVVCFAGYLDDTAFAQIGSGASLLVALYLLFNCNALCINSLLNGLREIKKYALSQLAAVLVGNLVIFAFIPFVSINELPHCFLLQGVFNLLFSIYFFTKLKFSKYSFSLNQYFRCYKDILKVGIGFWLPAVYLAFTEYMIRQYLMSKLSVDVVGVYQACWTISNMYVGIILTSMGVTLFPKLCQIINDKEKTNGILNEQIGFGLLISTPFLLVIFFFAPQILNILYAPSFEAGSDIIRWQLLGVVMRLLGFPFGYALMAKGKVRQFVVSQFIFSSANILLMIFIVELYGFEGIGISYFVSYFVYLLMVALYCKWSLGFEFSKPTIKLIIYISLMIILLIIMFKILIGYLFYFLGIVVISLSILFCLHSLKTEYKINPVAFLKHKFKR